jgi:hypothetical protein
VWAVVKSPTEKGGNFMATAVIQRSGWIVTLAICSVVTLAAAASFSGTWKLNLAKSNLSGQTATISKGASGINRFESEGFACVGFNIR